MAIRAFRRYGPALSAFALVSAALPAAAVQSPEACRVEGWSRDPDPAGLRVRAAPSGEAKVLGRLPPTRLDEDGRRVGPVFSLVEARNGWFRVRDVHVEDGSKPRRFPKAGWVHGSLIGLGAQTSRGYATPKAGSRVVVDLGRAWVTPDIVAGVADCAGEWVKLRLKHKPAMPPAWFNRVCANQWTSCDMPDAPRSGG